jgi:hypothetical protein
MEMIREHYGLTAMRVGYSRPEGGGSVRGAGVMTCELRSPLEPTESWEVPADAIGFLAGRSDSDDGIERDLESCRSWLERCDAIDRLRSDGEALWLAVTPEHPRLPALDWETGLAALGLPVLRLPGRLGKPTAAPLRPRIAVCVSVPMAKGAFDADDLVAGALAAMRASPGQEPEVHLFADAQLTPTLRRLDGVIVHDPVGEGPHDRVDRWSGDPEPASTGRPWADWIARALGESSVDVLHLIGHGFLAADQGAFAVAEQPDRNFDPHRARFLWPQQVAGLMTATGAWGLVVTAAPRNYSAPGLRLLAARVAPLRSAATVLHDAGRGGAGDRLTAAYRLLLDHPAPPPPDTRGLMMIMHPGRCGFEEEPRPGSAAYRPGVSRLGALVDGGADLPGWVVGARRQVAQWETQLSFDSDSEQTRATRAGLEVAKERLDALMRDELDAGGTQ